jgi:membrane fusion protein (multidrug efflux system)
VTRDAKGNASAMVVDPAGRVSVRPIATDRAIGDRWLVTSGLADGDQVIVQGLQRIQPGAAVKAVPSVPAAPLAPQPSAAAPAK